MPYILVQHSVEDYARWKAGFDGNGASREAGGSKGAIVFRSAEDPNQVTVLLEWEDLDKARAFASSDELREAMQHAGVTGPPSVSFLEEMDRQAA
jgi:heme-degrading monooxygenase HmoA